MRAWMFAAGLAVACAVPRGALAQDAELNLKGAIDFHVHQAPDSVGHVRSGTSTGTNGV